LLITSLDTHIQILCIIIFKSVVKSCRPLRR